MRPSRGSVRAVGLVFVLLAAAAPVCAQTASELFARASEAFEQADYRTALDGFETARNAGMSGPAIEYNIAVCRYRLGQWAAAEAGFAMLAARYPSMRALASYNRGLALVRLDRDAEARAAFDAARRGSDARLTALADAMLARLGDTAQAAAPARAWVKYVDLGFGHDDNVALVDEAGLLAGPSADSAFAEIYGQLSGPLTEAGRWRLDASGYLARYPDADEFDQAVLQVATAYGWQHGAWRFDTGPYLSQSTLDGESFERRVGGMLRGRRELGRASSLALTLRHEVIDAGDTRFGFVDGDRNFVRARFERRGEVLRWRADFDHERNDRASASVSPTRNGLGVSLRRPLAPAWFGELRYSYRTSRYDDLAAARSETLDVLAVSAGRDLGAGWQWLAQYELSRNDSDDSRFDYRRHRLTLSFGKLF